MREYCVDFHGYVRVSAHDYDEAMDKAACCIEQGMTEEYYIDDVTLEDCDPNDERI